MPNVPTHHTSVWQSAGIGIRPTIYFCIHNTVWFCFLECPQVSSLDWKNNDHDCSDAWRTILDEDVRLYPKAMFWAGRLLANEMEAATWNPGNLMVGMAIHKNPSISVVKAVESSRGLLNEVAVSDHTLKTQIEDTGARTLELPLLVRCLYIHFVLSQIGAEFCGAFPSRSWEGKFQRPSTCVFYLSFYGRLRKMDPVNDLQPLANIHNTLLQLGGLVTMK